MRVRVELQIRTELNNGRYKIVDSKPTIVSALGAIPKSKDSNAVRIIHDASRPLGKALNDYAPKTTFKYQCVQDAVDLTTTNCYYAKVDLSQAYRSVKIHPSNHSATGLKWRFNGHTSDTYIVDERLPFGASRSPFIFNRLTQAVRAIMAARGYKTMVCYLDDFLVVCSTYDECLRTLNALLSLVRELGFQINYNKVGGPCQHITFLGILLDSRHMTTSIPNSKMNEIETILKKFLISKKVTKQQIQSLAGKLNWVTQCVYGGRYHMRRLLERANTLKSQWHRTIVTVDMKKDAWWWIKFMRIFNGTMPMIDNRPASPVSIDACKTAGGAFYNGDIAYTPWIGDTITSLPINYLEVLALEPAAQRWGHLWANKKVYVHTDNKAACHIINNGCSKNMVVMDSLRRVFWLSAVYNFRIKAVYYPGVYNVLADAVSRLHERNGLERLTDAMRDTGYLYLQEPVWSNSSWIMKSGRI